MTTATAPAGVIEHIDPQALTVDPNIRDEAEASLDKEFLASIRENGVLVPIVARRDDEGVHVRYGQRRTLAAQQVGLSTVLVYVVDVDQDDVAQRIIEQLAENDHRRDITEANRIQASRALELEGLFPTAIAKRTGTKRDKIKTSLAVAASDIGTRLIAEAGITLDQAAVLLEFEDDAEVVDVLTSIALNNPGYFPVRVERARQDRARNVVRAAAEAVEAEKGHRILTEWPESGAAPWPLHSLDTASGDRVTEETIEGRDGVAVYVQVWGNETTRVNYFIDAPEALGLTVSASATVSNSGPMTDEQKAERRTVIANNKEWDAAEVVRREWLGIVLGRKTLPKDAAQVIALSLTASRHAVSDAMGKGNSLAAELIGLDRNAGYYTDAFGDYLQAHPSKAGHVTLAIVLGGIESSTSRRTWRAPSETVARYLQTLANWGYTLSPVEQIAAMIEPTEN